VVKLYIVFSWGETPCSLVDGSQRFGGTYCLPEDGCGTFFVHQLSECFSPCLSLSSPKLVYIIFKNSVLTAKKSPLQRSTG
jgi:hypothetical protein